MNRLFQLKIPTILGLALIILGTASGVYLTLQNQNPLTKASAENTPKNIKITNIEESSASISWTTDTKAAGFISFSTKETDQTALDDQDEGAPSPRLLHHVSLKSLTPQTSYQFKIMPTQASDTSSFSTAPESQTQNGLLPVIGTVLDGENPLSDGLVYLEIPGAFPQSTTVKQFSSFLISLNQARTADLSDVFKSTSGEIGKLTVVTTDGRQAKASFSLVSLGRPLDPLKVGQDLDLTAAATPEPQPSPSLNPQFDLNGDGLINASDYSELIDNLGKNPKNKKADLNSDGVVDQKDIKLIQAQIPKISK